MSAGNIGFALGVLSGASIGAAIMFAIAERWRLK